jgi:hypothetical protein
MGDYPSSAGSMAGIAMLYKVKFYCNKSNLLQAHKQALVGVWSTSFCVCSGGFVVRAFCCSITFVCIALETAAIPPGGAGGNSRFGLLSPRCLRPEPESGHSLTGCGRSFVDV